MTAKDIVNIPDPQSLLDICRTAKLARQNSGSDYFGGSDVPHLLQCSRITSRLAWEAKPWKQRYSYKLHNSKRRILVDRGETKLPLASVHVLEYHC